MSAFTHVFDALWAGLEGYGPEIQGRRPSRLASLAPQGDGSRGYLFQHKKGQ